MASEKNGFDPFLIAAIVETESGYAVRKRGRHGEIGLMQIKPSTARWIAKRVGLPWRGPKMLEDPVWNVKLGTAYLAYLRDEFSQREDLFLSAYNMGARNVKRALSRRMAPKRYAARVFGRYRRFGERQS